MAGRSGSCRTGAHRVGSILPMGAPEMRYSPLLPLGPDATGYRLLTTDGVDVIDGPGGRRFLTVEPAVLTRLTAEAMHDIAHYLRPAHLEIGRASCRERV